MKMLALIIAQTWDRVSTVFLENVRYLSRRVLSDHALQHMPITSLEIRCILYSLSLVSRYHNLYHYILERPDLASARAKINDLLAFLFTGIQLVLRLLHLTRRVRSNECWGARVKCRCRVYALRGR